jgi:hypothetical protein
MPGRRNQEEYRKMYYKKLKAEGLCTHCQKPNPTKRTLCEACTTKYNITNREQKAKLREEESARIDADKEEYKMTEEERLYNKERWKLFFNTNPSPPTEYVYKIRDMYERHKNR